MPKGSGNIRTHKYSSNRAPWYSDATVTGDTGLLAAAGTKTITPVYAVAPGVSSGTFSQAPGIASSVYIINSSGQAATIQITVARNETGDQTEQAIAANAFYLASTEVLPWFDCRVVSIIEKNVGGSTQTGQGVRYFFVMESTEH